MNLITGLSVSSDLIISSPLLYFCLVSLQTLRERRKAEEQARGEKPEKTTDMKMKDKDEDSSYNRCSSVDLEKVNYCVCVLFGLTWYVMTQGRVCLYIQYLCVCVCVFVE